MRSDFGPAASELLASCLGEGQSECNAPANKIMLEFGNTGQKGRHHAALRRGWFERDPIQRNHRQVFAL